ncbi:Voltage-gated hydrogen channel 1 [Grifola frondosa]|uniref:Voltage-gated hydrogen channel 1 n=1 Tax=Grifola frondosa TaxID=5627 RepID=A0A1C7MGL9_GRIFR|nr:Voltage-gated hydrogen channel 1 [Grifola frondosa]
MSEQDPLLPSQTNADNDVEANQRPEPSKHARWRNQTAEFLESAPLHYSVITLARISPILVVIAVLIDSVCVLADLGYSFLSEDCTPIEGPDAPTWLNVLAEISLAITTIFLVEIPVTLWAAGPIFFNPFGPVPHAVLHLFDALVILTTFILEVVLRGRERELASLLIILRLWRLVKLVQGRATVNQLLCERCLRIVPQGIAVSAGELEEEDAKMLAETREKLAEATSALKEVRAENQQLRARVAWLDSGDTGSSTS